MNTKMKVPKALIAIIITVIGISFLMNTASDVQLGFGIIMVYLGMRDLLAL